MLKARKLGISTPVLFDVELEAGTIYMERVDGSSIKALLKQGLPPAGSNPPYSSQRCLSIV